METPLITLIYTHNIGGALDLLPRLHTHIKAIQHTLESPVYVVDIGGSCLPDVWPCDVTNGRAVLIGLDAMGYIAANVDNLDSASRERMVDQSMMALVDSAHPHEIDGLAFCVGEQAPTQGRRIELIPSPIPPTPEKITFPALEQGMIGVIHVYEHQVIAHKEALPPHTLPDATIAGTVDFIREEARYYSSRQNGHTMP
jgi:hypothetical protein